MFSANPSDCSLLLLLLLQDGLHELPDFLPTLLGMSVLIFSIFFVSTSLVLPPCGRFCQLSSARKTSLSYRIVLAT